MSYSIEKTGDCIRKFLFNLENVNLSSEIGQILREKQKASNLKGFRRGKAPISVIQNIYGEEARADVFHRFISSQLVQVAEEEKISIVGTPKVSDFEYEEKLAEVNFTVEIECLPELSIKDFSHLSFSKESANIADDDVESEVNKMLESKAEMVEAEEGSILSNSHFAVINFQGELENGDRPKEMSAEEYLLEIGANSFIPGFETAMLGMKVGDKRDIPLSFPENYHSKKLQNAKATFAAELLEIKNKVLPDLSDDVAQEFDYDSANDMRGKIKAHLHQQKEEMSKKKLHGEIIDKLIMENHFDVPSTLVEDQGRIIRENIVGNLKSKGFSEGQIQDYFEKWVEDVREKAIHQVRSGLIFSALSKRYSIEVSEDDYRARCKEVAERAGITLEEVLEYYNKHKEVEQGLRQLIWEESIFTKIYEEVTIVAI